MNVFPYNNPVPIKASWFFFPCMWLKTWFGVLCLFIVVLPEGTKEMWWHRASHKSSAHWTETNKCSFRVAHTAICIAFWNSVEWEILANMKQSLQRLGFWKKIPWCQKGGSASLKVTRRFWRQHLFLLYSSWKTWLQRLSCSGVWVRVDKHYSHRGLVIPQFCVFHN